MNKATAIIIGSGIAGMASAIRLAVRGFDVTVFEQNDYPGGKLTSFSKGDYRFDAGPSLFTQPYLVDELFRLAGKNPKEYFQYTRLDNLCNYFYEDGTTLSASANVHHFAAEVEKVLNVDQEIVLNHLEKSEFIYKTTAHLFLDRSLHQLKTYLRWETLISCLKLPFIGINQSLNRFNQSKLNNNKLTQLFNRYATYNGSNPFKAPSTLHVIPHLEFNEGAYLPQNGMHDITQSLYQLAKDLKVKFVFNTSIEEILHDKKKVTGVKTKKQSYVADKVICNMDIALTYAKLLPKIKTPNKIKYQERSSSALIFYWSISRRFENLDVHNILFSDNYKEEFNHIFHQKSIFKDPTVYINITSKKIKGDAPEHGENWFVMINVPANDGSQNWDQLIANARESIVQKINRILKVNIESHIIDEAVLDPRKIEKRTFSHQGSLYGTSSNSKLAAFFRQNNKSSHLKNLYFVGGSVHPGGGIPLALRSAKIVDGLIKKVQL